MSNQKGLGKHSILKARRERREKIINTIIHRAIYEFQHRNYHRIALMEMEFGKYVGRSVMDIPLRYLDETVSSMPETVFVRKIKEYLDCIWEKLYVFRNVAATGSKSCFTSRMPNFSLNELKQKFCKAHNLEAFPYDF